MSNPGRGKYDRSTTAAQRRERQREQLLDDATEVFAARGYRATRVDDIVEVAQVSRRTLYEHFESIDAMLTEVYDRAVRMSFAQVVTRLAAVTDPIDRISVGIAAYFDMIATNPGPARVVFEVYRHAGAEQAARYEVNAMRYAAIMLELLNAAFAAGRLRRAPDEPSVYALTKGLEAIGVRALHRGDHAHLPALSPAMATLVLAAFS